MSGQVSRDSAGEYQADERAGVAHKGGVICISEVIDIFPGNLDSSLFLTQSSISQ